MSDDSSTPVERQLTLQIIDVNLNRAAEGLRVVEEYCRFVLGSGSLVTRCKALRDSLHTALTPIDRAERLSARDTPNDVGASSDFAAGIRAADDATSLAQIAIKNGERVKEALRVIEECAKAGHAEVARDVGALRYQWYTLEKDVQLAGEVDSRLAIARLYVLIDGRSSECAFVERVHSLIEGGVHIFQLRDKNVDDRALLSRARLLRRVIDESSQRPLMIVNDRPDIAALSRADGVHVGQEELEVGDARAIVGSKMLVGVSTHTIEQARRAAADGADYIGCGPTFPSGTKQFDHFPGLDFLRQVAAEISIPAFAIGGITLANLSAVLATGFHRVAVGGAVNGSDDSSAEVQSWLTLLQQKT